eukprot:12130770-Alexandrium_andersonii.AAC.1
MEAKRWVPQDQTRGAIWMIRLDLATNQLAEICQGAPPPIRLPRPTISGCGTTYPEDPSVLGQRRRLALSIEDYEALSPH